MLEEIKSGISSKAWISEIVQNIKMNKWVQTLFVCTLGLKPQMKFKHPQLSRLHQSISCHVHSDSYEQLFSLLFRPSSLKKKTKKKNPAGIQTALKFQHFSMGQIQWMKTGARRIHNSEKKKEKDTQTTDNGWVSLTD